MGWLSATDLTAPPHRNDHRERAEGSGHCDSGEGGRVGDMAPHNTHNIGAQISGRRCGRSPPSPSQNPLGYQPVTASEASGATGGGRGRPAPGGPPGPGGAVGPAVRRRGASGSGGGRAGRGRARARGEGRIESQRWKCSRASEAGAGPTGGGGLRRG